MNGTDPIRVTDHAIVRYAERVMGLEPEAIKSKILTKENLEVINRLGDCQVPVDPDMRAVIRGRTVVTITPA